MSSFTGHILCYVNGSLTQYAFTRYKNSLFSAFCIKFVYNTLKSLENVIKYIFIHCFLLHVVSPSPKQLANANTCGITFCSMTPANK